MARKNTHWFTVKNSIIAAGFVLAIIVGQSMTREIRTRSKAAAGNAQISLQPTTVSIPPNQTLQVWITTDKPVAFARVHISFDSAKLVLSAAPLTNKLTRIVSQTPLSEANSTGSYVFVVGLDPSQVASPPSGTFQLTALPFSSKISDPNSSAQVSIISTDTQIVDSSAVPFMLTTAHSTITINPTAPTTTTTPTPTRSPSPTPTRIPTPTTDSTAPVVTITSPLDGSTFTKNITVRAQANDPESSITSIKLYFDAKLYATCTSTTSCSSRMNTNKVSKGTHTVVATAVNGSGLTSSRVVTIIKR